MPLFASLSRRVPFPRIAAFFPAGCIASGIVLVTTGLLLAGPAALAAPNAHRSSTKTPAGPATIQVGATNYTDARAWFGRLGYRAQKTENTRALVLKGPSDGTLRFEVDSREASLHGLRTFLSEPAILSGSSIFVPTPDIERFLTPMVRPSQFKAPPLRTIVIDAGHGGNDTGARNQTVKFNEKDGSLDVARQLKKLLGQDRWQVLMTRDDDSFVELAERAEFAKRKKADLFVSIHFNAVAKNPGDVRGTETYVLTPQFMRSTSSAKITPDDRKAQPGNKYDAWSAVLGYHMHRELLTGLKTEDRGLKRARFAVLRLADCPAVLVEAAYLTNDTEAKLIATPAYRARIAKALYAAIVAYDATRVAAGR
ncbi:MAG: N-acetylmuramoyl-L-alanine amidase [Verrucomicrobia bacterium]|nr:N-acetylmuramoyl-L-alanine amidase [Verrucomicrobiota bacterium]